MPELAGRGQGRKQESNSDECLFHWEHFFLFNWYVPQGRFVYAIETRFQCRQFLCIRFCLVCIYFRTTSKGEGQVLGKIFKLRNQRRAIVSEREYRTVIPIPARATVVLVGGDIDKDAFVKIRYRGRVLLMHSEDLRNSGQLLGRLP